MGTWEKIKVGDPTHPPPPPLRFFGLGRSLELHLEIKRELFPQLYMNPQAPKYMYFRFRHILGEVQKKA